MVTQSWTGGTNCIFPTHHLYSRPTNIADTHLCHLHLCLLLTLRLCGLCNVICVDCNLDCVNPRTEQFVYIVEHDSKTTVMYFKGRLMSVFESILLVFNKVQP